MSNTVDLGATSPALPARVVLVRRRLGAAARADMAAARDANRAAALAEWRAQSLVLECGILGDRILDAVASGDTSRLDDGRALAYLMGARK